MDDDDIIFEEIEEDDQPSDATLIFAEEINKQFKKEFPLKAETEKKRQLAAFRLNAPSMAKKLDFDMTLSPVPAMKAEVASARTAQTSAERQLNALRQEHEKLKQELERRDWKLDRKTAHLEECRVKNQELQAENKRLIQQMTRTVESCDSNHEAWAQFGKKYYTWFYMASAQLDCVKIYLDTGGKFDDLEEIEQLNKAPRDMLRQLETFELDDETVAALSVGSIQQYCGVEFLQKVKPPEAVRETARADASIANLTLPQTNQTVLDDPNSTLMDQTMMTEGCLANRSLIDYEKDEKIQRLLLENSVLKDRLNVSVGRAEKSMMMEEKNRTLEVEKNALQRKLDSTFNEIEAMRIGQANQLFKINEKVSTETDNSAKQLQLIDRINKLVLKNNQLEKDFEAATSRMTKIMRESADCEKRNERLEDAFSSENEKRQQLESEKKQLTEQLEANSSKIKELEERVEKLQSELQEALEKTITEVKPDAPAPTDAGNSTQIFHMASNPLQSAHAEYQAAESRKRKMSDAPEGDTTAKQFREDRIAELEEQIDICEREKKVLEDSYNLHKELASKFRQVCVALTGLQIKLKDADEGICTVQSEYEAGSTRQFVFKYFYGTPRIDMLDVDCESSTEMIRKWEPLMKKYIGERNSIPAFLAAMTLQMEQSRDFDETVHERTHTFSVLHED